MAGLTSWNVMIFMTTLLIARAFIKPITAFGGLPVYIKGPVAADKINSGLPSERINLSPFTKDFRGGGHSNEYALNLLLPSLRADFS